MVSPVMSDIDPRAPETYRRRRLVSKYFLQGVGNFVQIAEKLGIENRDLIKTDVRTLKRGWNKEFARGNRYVKSLEIKKIDEVERMAWESYNKSLMINEEGEATSQGNTKYLEIILRCVEKRCNILGIIDNRTIVNREVNTNSLSVDQFVQQAALKSKEYRIQRTDIIINNNDFDNNNIKSVEDLSNSSNIQEEIEIWVD